MSMEIENIIEELKSIKTDSEKTKGENKKLVDAFKKLKDHNIQLVKEKEILQSLIKVKDDVLNTLETALNDYRKVTVDKINKDIEKKKGKKDD